MSAEALKVVKEGQLKIIPQASEKEWYRWLENPQDWCISRQLWWGHRVPAYFVVIQGDANDVSRISIIFLIKNSDLMILVGSLEDLLKKLLNLH